MSVDRRSVLAAILLATGAGLVGTDVVAGREPPAPRADPPPQSGGTASFRHRPAPGVAEPAWLAVPAIGVRTDLLRLGLAPDGTLEVPSMAQAGTAGWYDASPRPGATGPAVIVGHVDSTTGPAVFSRLSALTPGARVVVGRTDGSTATFRVTRLARHPKDRFPTAAVYGDTRRPELRLITCGGSYAPGRGYLDNLVVDAVLTP